MVRVRTNSHSRARKIGERWKLNGLLVVQSGQQLGEFIRDRFKFGTSVGAPHAAQEKRSGFTRRHRFLARRYIAMLAEGAIEIAAGELVMDLSACLGLGLPGPVRLRNGPLQKIVRVRDCALGRKCHVGTPISKASPPLPSLNEHG